MIRIKPIAPFGEIASRSPALSERITARNHDAGMSNRCDASAIDAATEWTGLTASAALADAGPASVNRVPSVRRRTTAMTAVAPHRGRHMTDWRKTRGQQRAGKEEGCARDESSAIAA